MNTRALIEAEEDFHYDSVDMDDSMVNALNIEFPEWTWVLLSGSTTDGVSGTMENRSTSLIVRPTSVGPDWVPNRVDLIICSGFGDTERTYGMIDSMDQLSSCVRDATQWLRDRWASRGGGHRRIGRVQESNDEDFDYNIPAVDQEAIDDLNRIWKRYRIPPTRYRFKIVGDNQFIKVDWLTAHNVPHTAILDVDTEYHRGGEVSRWHAVFKSWSDTVYKFDNLWQFSEYVFDDGTLSP